MTKVEAHAAARCRTANTIRITTVFSIPTARSGQVLVPLTNEEIAAAKAHWEAKNDESLVDKINSETSGGLKELVVSLLTGKRTESEEADEVCTNCTDVLACLLYTSPSPRDLSTSRMPSSA